MNDELPPLLPSVAPFAGGMPSFNPAFTGATASYPGMDRVMQQQMMMMMQNGMGSGGFGNFPMMGKLLAPFSIA